MLESDEKAIARRLRQGMDEAGVSNTALAGATETTVQGVGDWLRTGKISREKLPAIARAIRRSTDWLLGIAGNTELGPEIRGRVPLISWVQAGSWSTIVDNLQPGDAEEWIATSVPIHKHTYALRVNGDSMTNPSGEPSFPHGSIIIVEPDAIDAPEKLVNSLVIVKRTGDDEATFKKLVRDAGRFYLMPLNPQYPRLELQEGDVLCGVVRSREIRFF